MKSWAGSAVVATLIVAFIAPGLNSRPDAGDLRDAVPPDMFMAVYARHNPERDYQKRHFEEVWKAVEQSRIVERVVQLVQSKMADGDIQQMIKFRDSLKEAIAPIDFQKLMDAEEFIYAQKMDKTTLQNMLVVRVPDGGAASLMEGIGNLLDMAKSVAGGDLNIKDETVGDMMLRSVVLRPGVQMSPTIAVRGDLFLYSSTPDLAKLSLELLDNPELESKFDDVRVEEAMKHLPEAEDAMTFFDGRAMAEQLTSIVSTIQTAAAGNDEALRIAGVIDSLLSEVNIVDYEVSVEYTDGFTNRTSSYGQYVDGYESTVAGKMIADQQPFTNWDKWVPADANGFSLNSGANLHPIYEWVTTVIPAAFPDSEEFFYELEQIQNKFDVHLDADILQGFGGESISVTLPGPVTPLGQTSKSVSMFRCNKPDRVNELIHRGLNELMKVPQVRQQGVTVQPSASIDGFHEIRAGLFMMMGGMNPTFGFKDGWMVAGSHSDAIQKVLLTHGGESETIATSDTFTKFGLPVSGDVKSISYSNTGESIRQMASSLQQVGAMLPMMLAMAGNQNGMAELAPLKDVLGLMPSVGRILAKFDFIESQLSVSQPGTEPGTWVSHSVTMIRPPAARSETNAGLPASDDSPGTEAAQPKN